MSQIIELTEVKELALVAGGCWCYCFRKPPQMRSPTVRLGEMSDEAECINKCKVSPDTSKFYKCTPYPPYQAPPPRELTELELSILSALREQYYGNSPLN